MPLLEDDAEVGRVPGEEHLLPKNRTWLASSVRWNVNSGILSCAYAHAAHVPVRGHVVAAVARHVAHVAVVHVGVIHCLGLGTLRSIGLVESQKGQGWR